MSKPTPTDDPLLPVFTVGTVARILKVSVQTLRLYEQRGLIIIKKSTGNQRLYSVADVERLKCIRHAITEEKISIEGIRKIHAMIPCWIHVNCPMEQRIQCPSYERNDAGCWTYKHQSNVCADRDCQTCEIYLMSNNCSEIKHLIRDRLNAGINNPIPLENQAKDASV
ncbi:MAG: MerR family transcriptional regulator [bacterium]|nr:MerR family transcriptional regulator [bacterium]